MGGCGSWQTRSGVVGLGLGVGLCWWLQTWLMSTSDLRRSMPRARSEIFAGSCSYLGLGLGFGLGIES